MNKDQLIAKQQLEIEDLKQENSQHIDFIKSFVSACYAIGGPLNDNILGFNQEQRRFLKGWADSFNSLIPYKEDD